MKKLMILVTCCLIHFELANNAAFAQEKPFSISFGGGAGSVPLNDVIKFTEIAHTVVADGGRFYDFFEKEDHGKFGFLKIAYHIDNTWGTSLLFETVNISAQGKSTHGGFGGPIRTADEDWEFTSVPISILYEFFFRGRDNRFSPVFGIGPSLYISRLVKKDVLTSIDTGMKSKSEFKETQIGYGLLLFIDLQSSFNRFFVNSRFQARLAEGMRIQDKQTHNSYDVDFTGVDFTFGFGWRF
ncbi:hypothetical protein IID62_03245 [candidate division KSB1 bacterium]|nr:hypothetical protein [candidate division KSB1 bacterium]